MTSDRKYFSYFFICKLPRYVLPSFESVGISIQEKNGKIDFQDGRHSGHLEFFIGTILAVFDLQDAPIFPTKFRISWPFGSGKSAKNRFSRCPPLWPSRISDQSKFGNF